MSTDDSEFDHIFVYIFNCIATVLAAGATDTRSAWDKLKENEDKRTRQEPIDPIDGIAPIKVDMSMFDDEDDNL
jgi:hypothetical protein